MTTTTYYGLREITPEFVRGAVGSGQPIHLIDVPDGDYMPVRARCGAICGWRSTTMSLDGEHICPDCEARP